MPSTSTITSIHGSRGRVNQRSSLALAGSVILGNLLLWASANVQVPFWPVPMTMQSYVVLSLGALFGWRLGAITVAAYLAEGAAGLPVFAGTPATGIGLAYMAGPTGGYLAGYLIAVVLVGRYINLGSPYSHLRTMTALLVGEAAVLLSGCAWLAASLGWEKAIQVGFGPFLLGDALKIALAAATISYGRPFGLSLSGRSFE